MNLDFGDPRNAQCDTLMDFIKTTPLERLLSEKAGRVLEVGCGRGPFGRRLLAEFPLPHTVTGVDINPRSISALHASIVAENLQARYIPLQADINRGDLFPGNHFDLILAPSILHHFTPLHPTPVPDNICNWLRSDGYLLIFDPNGANPVLQISNRISRLLVRHFKSVRKHKVPEETMYTPKYLRRVFTTCGLEFMQGATVEPYLPVMNQRYVLLAIRNFFNNIIQPFTHGDWRGQTIVMLLKKPRDASRAPASKP